MPTFTKWLAGLDQSTYRGFVLYAERHYGFLEKLGGPLPEDIVQEAINRMLGGERATPAGDVDAKVHFAYVYRIIDSLCSHEYEELRKCLTCSIDDADHELNSEITPERITAITDLMQSFKNQISLEKRDLFDLILAEHSQKEIAERLQVSNATVSRRRKELTEQWTAFCREHEPDADF